MQPNELPEGKPSGSYAVMAQRKSPRTELDPYWTPPWATRALFDHVFHPLGIPISGAVWEPACGSGIMAEVLAEYYPSVLATDIVDYPQKGGRQPVLIDFLGERWPDHFVTSVITNPPFSSADRFALRAIQIRPQQIALLVRSNWVEGKGRYEHLFSKYPPAAVAQFVERVPMVKGRWNPDASTATAYSWVVWDRPHQRRRSTEFIWIPPGQRKALTRPDDVERFAS